MNREVWVERVNGSVIRIFRGSHSGDWKRALAAGTLFTCPKFDAVGLIRKQIWQRCGGACEWCGKRITETGLLWKRGHMHEQIPKGNGGEISLDNSVMICYTCHFEDDRAHGQRRPQFTKSIYLEE
jgi:hypothetical protein